MESEIFGSARVERGSKEAREVVDKGQIRQGQYASLGIRMFFAAIFCCCCWGLFTNTYRHGLLAQSRQYSSHFTVLTMYPECFFFVRFYSRIRLFCIMWLACVYTFLPFGPTILYICLFTYIHNPQVHLYSTHCILYIIFIMCIGDNIVYISISRHNMHIMVWLYTIIRYLTSNYTKFRDKSENKCEKNSV